MSGRARDRHRETGKGNGVPEVVVLDYALMRAGGGREIVAGLVIQDPYAVWPTTVCSLWSATDRLLLTACCWPPPTDCPLVPCRWPPTRHLPWPSRAYYWPPTSGRLVLTAGYWSLTAGHLLPAPDYWPPTTDRLPLDAYYCQPLSGRLLPFYGRLLFTAATYRPSDTGLLLAASTWLPSTSYWPPTTGRRL